jgi:hypothetical protein
MTIDPHVIQGFGRATGIFAFMNTRWGWPAIESLHFIGLASLLGTVGLLDLRILGVGRGVSMASLHRLVPFGIAAFALSFVTGSMFFVTMPDQYLFNPAFQLKLSFMAIAGVNTAAFYLIAARGVDAAGPDAVAPLPAKIVAAISLICWTAVIVLGRVITIYRPPFHSCPWC